MTNPLTLNAPLKGYCAAAIGHPIHEPYHQHEYGVPLYDEAALCERLVLEINQAGLSWLTILKKREGFRKAYADFNVAVLAAFTEADQARLLNDPQIIRNRLKVKAAIENARRIVALRDSHGGFYAWLLAHHPRRKTEWVKLFKKTFVFTGGEITGEFLMSIGLLPGAHQPECPVFQRLSQLSAPPLWMQVVQQQPHFYDENASIPILEQGGRFGGKT